MMARSYNGDEPLGPFARVAYLALNRLNNRAPYRRLDPELSIADFDSGDLERLDELPGLPSPSRALCDLFWMRLPWAAIAEEVGPLRIVDVGCGSGRYGPSLQRWSEGRIARYVGIDRDAHDGWAALESGHPFTEFRRGDAGAIGSLIPFDTNLIVSQSTLEHLPDDVHVLDEIHAFAHRSARPLLQIHLVPSQACLWTYLWHGYRQYTPRALSARTRRFADCSSRLVVRLGGPASNRLHYRFVTWPLLIRRRGDRRTASPDQYRRELRDALSRDAVGPHRSPAFYALLIHSHARGRVLDAGPWRSQKPR
jgi:SAM-dependent methyltransferase